MYENSTAHIINVKQKPLLPSTHPAGTHTRIDAPLSGATLTSQCHRRRSPILGVLYYGVMVALSALRVNRNSKKNLGLSFVERLPYVTPATVRAGAADLLRRGRWFPSEKRLVKKECK